MNGKPSELFLIVLIATVVSPIPVAAAEPTDEEWRKLYKQARNRKRNVTWNNDSCDMWEVPRSLPLEPACALKQGGLLISRPLTQSTPC